MRQTSDSDAVRVGERLKAAGWRIGLVDMAGGGVVADRLTYVAGSSAYFAGAINPASPATLRRWLPADSADHAQDAFRLAQRTAEWIRRELGVEVGLAIIGVLPPAAEVPDRTVSLALAGPDGLTVQRPRLAGTAVEIQDGLARAALGLLSDYLEFQEDSRLPR